MSGLAPHALPDDEAGRDAAERPHADGRVIPLLMLSARELEVVRELAVGRRAAEIAARLHISENTVRSHVRNAMAKTGARSQAHLVAIAVLAGGFDCERKRHILRHLPNPPAERPHRGPQLCRDAGK